MMVDKRESTVLMRDTTFRSQCLLHTVDTFYRVSNTSCLRSGHNSRQHQANVRHCSLLSCNCILFVSRDFFYISLLFTIIFQYKSKLNRWCYNFRFSSIQEEFRLEYILPYRLFYHDYNMKFKCRSDR